MYYTETQLRSARIRWRNKPREWPNVDVETPVSSLWFLEMGVNLIRKTLQLLESSIGEYSTAGFSHTRPTRPSFNSGWQVNSFPPRRDAAIPRGKIDPFPGFPTGSGGSYITDGHLYISNPALRPGSSELPVALAFDLLGIQKHFLSANAPELRNSGCALLLFYRRLGNPRAMEIGTYRSPVLSYSFLFFSFFFYSSAKISMSRGSSRIVILIFSHQTFTDCLTEDCMTQLKK